jgi:hypothetical protein
MRRTLLLLLLLGTVTAAALWHRSRFLPLAFESRSPSPAPADDRLVLRVGGGEPLLAPPPPQAVEIAPLTDLRPASTEIASPPTPSRRHVVRAGETLSEIVKGAYGTARPSLVEAVARHNEIRDPDRIPIGAILRLPLDLLAEASREPAPPGKERPARRLSP